LIGVKDQILQLERQLQKIGSLGIVGMGGIGKSTLANALSAHISHQFDGTCFVGDFKGETCTFIFKHKLEDTQEAPQVKKLIEARIMLEHIWKTKSILIVVDNVSEQIDLHQLLGDQILKDVSGSKLIASSRGRQSFGRYIPKAGIVNVKTLEGDSPMELFSMHAFGTDQSCEPYLKHVVDKIVNACGGLPLSLEVMGKCMHGERQLRIWERTLHRLLKARHDGSPDEQIWKTLRISFDELGDREKNMFIDISCFSNQLDPYLPSSYFLGDDIIRMSDLDDNIAQKTLKILNSKSLVTMDSDGKLKIHDQLCAMGRMLANLEEFKETRLVNFCLGTFIEHCMQKVSTM
jgi:energy-coupling factor transporter ATP-binding protein EcfA2